MNTQKSLSADHDYIAHAICRKINDAKCLFVKDGFGIKKIPVKMASIENKDINFAGRNMSDIFVETKTGEHYYLEIINKNKLTEEKISKYRLCGKKVFALIVTDIVTDYYSVEMIEKAIKRYMMFGFTEI